MCLSIPEILRRNYMSMFAKHKEFGNAAVIRFPSGNQGRLNATGHFTSATRRDFAYSMIGQKRMDNIESWVSTLSAPRISRAIWIETGVCRGGAVIFMEGYLKTYGT